MSVEPGSVEFGAVEAGPVEAVARRLYEAQSAADTAALGELLSDDLSWSHANGFQEDKKSRIERVAAGAYGTSTMDYSPEQVWRLGDVTVVAGMVLVSGQIAGTSMDGRAYLAVDVWCRRDGRWQLLAHHIARAADPAPQRA